MNSVTSIKGSQSSESAKAPSAPKATEQDLMDEFSSLLSNITRKLESQSQDLFLSMDLKAAAPVAKETLKAAKKEKETAKETRKEEKEEKPAVSCEAPEKQARSEKKEQVTSEKNASSESPKKNEEVKAESPRVEDAPKEVTSPAAKEEPVVQEVAVPVQAEAPQAVEATQIPQGSEAAVSQAATAVQATSQAEEEPEESVQQVSQPAETIEREEDAAKPSLGEAAVEDESRPSIDAKPQSVKPDTAQAGEKAADKMAVPTADSADSEQPERLEAQKALKNALLESPVKEASRNKAEVKSVFESVALAAADTQVRIAPASQPSHLMASIVKEISSVTATGPSQGSNSLPGFASLFKSNESGKEATTKKAEQPLPRAVQTKTIERIEDALREVARSKDGKTISLRLDPPELGTVKIEVTVKDGTLSAKIVSESSQVTQVIRDKAFELQSVLRKLGLSVERVQVSVGQELQYQDTAGQSFSSNAQSRDGRASEEKSGASLTDLFSGIADGSSTTKNEVVDDHWVA